jgi:hypothetical protein
MNKQLISEISRIHNIMGVLNESPGPAPLITITDEIVKGIKNVLKPKGIVNKIKSFGTPIDTILARDIEDLSKVAAGTITITNDQLKNIVKRLIKNKKIEEYLIPKMIQNDVTIKNYIKDYESSIRQLKSNGGKLQDALADIDSFINRRNPITNRPYINLELPEMKEYIKKEFTDFAQKEFNPEIIKQMAKTTGKKFKQGWEMRKDTVSGALLTLKGAGYTIRNLFKKDLQKKLSPEEMSAVINFLLSGVADLKMLFQAGRTYGFPAVVGNFMGQLWKKFWFLFWVHYAFNLIAKSLKDFFHKGEEITDDKMNEFSKICYRLVRGFEIPSFGLITPGGWLGNLLIYVVFKSSGGSATKSKDAFSNYLKGSDENLNWWKGYPLGQKFLDYVLLNCFNLAENAEGEMVRTKAGDSSKSEIEKNAGVDLSNKKSIKPHTDINTPW